MNNSFGGSGLVEASIPSIQELAEVHAGVNSPSAPSPQKFLAFSPQEGRANQTKSAARSTAIGEERRRGYNSEKVARRRQGLALGLPPEAWTALDGNKAVCSKDPRASRDGEGKS